MTVIVLVGLGAFLTVLALNKSRFSNPTMDRWADHPAVIASAWAFTMALLYLRWRKERARELARGAV